jgi:2-polyprenyl-3-methyl-5-hydroxy-6-metoxy-1,4-benzoquinol methylase
MTGAGLRHRSSVTELMDDPDCDPRALDRTYADFRVINGLVAGWRRTYVRRLRPLLDAERATTLLDIGSGGGDIPRSLAGWAARDGLRLAITAIDPDARAHRFATSRPAPSALEFRAAGSAELVAEGRTYDLVTSNHLLHHLDADALAALLADSAALARRRVVHGDLERSRVALAVYGPATLPFARRSFIHTDGMRSIRRSYRAAELAAAVPPGWRVERQFPYRLLLTLDRPVRSAA